LDATGTVLYILLLGIVGMDPEGPHSLLLAQIDAVAGSVLHATKLHGDKGIAPPDEVFMQLAYAQ
jgi:hypothetical protein